MKNLENDIKTLAYVMRRTNYGEADRILNLITPVGKISAMAKGVRKSKSKLAGGVEMFTLSEVNVHAGRGDMGVLTGAKMVRHYGNIVKDLRRMELGVMVLKKASAYIEGAETADYFRIVDESLMGLNDGMGLDMVEAWFLINLMKTAGEEVNLYRDAGGEKLNVTQRYDWNVMEKALMPRESGEFGADEIKMMRLMMVAKLAVTSRVKGADVLMPKILGLLHTIAQ